MSLLDIHVLEFDYCKYIYETLSRENWKQWLKWLSPWFGIVPILPYTYLALLTSTQYSLLLQNTPDVYSIRYLPIDGIMAKTSIMMGSGRSNHKEVNVIFYASCNCGNYYYLEFNNKRRNVIQLSTQRTMGMFCYINETAVPTLTGICKNVI